MHKLNSDDQLSEHFKRSEFACKCGCGFSSPDPMLINVLEGIRRRYDVPISISSACRCKSHNKSVGGAENSAHLFGYAADIVVGRSLQKPVASLLNDLYPSKFGIGTYNTFTHIDIRAEKARW